MLEALEDRTLPSTVTWTGAAGNYDWDTAGNWSTSALPGASDDVAINQTGITITHSAAVADAVNSLNSQANISISGGSLALAGTSTITAGLTISGGTLTGAGNVTVDGMLDWTDGTLAGTGSLTALGGMVINTGSSLQSLDGLTLNNGTAAQPGSATVNVTGNGSLPVRDGAVFDNPAGATLTLNVPAGEYGGLYWDGMGPAPGFTNDGAVVQGNGGGRGQLLLPLVNHGSITAQTGTLELGIIYGSVTGPAVVSTGSIVGQPGTLLNFYYDGFNAAAGSSIQVDRVDFGSFAQVAGSYSAAGTTEIDGGASFTGTVSSLGNLLINGGTTDLSAATLPSAPLPSLSVSTANALLLGSHNLSVSGLVTWSNGALYGSGSLTALGGMVINTGSTLQVLDGLTLNNGTAAQPGTATVNVGGPLPIRDGAVFDNPSGATLTLNVPSNVGYGGFYWDGTGAAPSLVNDGAIVLGSGGGRGQLLVPLVNHGSITAQTGTLELGIIYGSVTGPAVVSTGSIVGQPGTLLNFYYDGFNAAAGSSIQVDRVDFGSFAQVAGSYQANLTTIEGAATFSGTVIEQIANPTQYGQIIDTSSLTLAGSLQIALVNGFVPRPGSQFTIIDDQTSQPINGAFTNLPQGGAIWDTTHTERFPITYVGGEGNDAVLTAIAPLTVNTNSSLMLVGNNPPPLTGTVNGTPFTGSITYTTAFGDQVDHHAEHGRDLRQFGRAVRRQRDAVGRQ
jgi:hypothetical protein